MTAATTITRFYRLPRDRRRMLMRAMYALTAASILVAFLPFRRALAFGSVPLGKSNGISPDECVWAIEAVSLRLPWRPVCIQKGLATQRLLRSGGVDGLLHYGVRSSGTAGKLEAHVWVTVGGRTIIGGEEAVGFAEVAAFP